MVVLAASPAVLFLRGRVILSAAHEHCRPGGLFQRFFHFGKTGAAALGAPMIRYRRLH